MKKVIVGMSGGVDSSVAAFLLKEQGYEVIGVTMQMWQEAGLEDVMAKAVADAKRVAEHIGIAHHVMDFSMEFKKEIVDNFIEEYRQGRTPNPCVLCNRQIKWTALLERCREFGADYVATGHYARIEQLANGRYAIKNSKTATKDQTYALYNLTQEQLAHTLMPLGDYEKEEVRRIAESIGVDVANKPDSQDICFIPDGDYKAFIRRQLGEDAILQQGNYVTADGEVLGTHDGIIGYTIGQRKGLGLSMGKPVFVTEIRPDTNEVVIGDNEELHTCEVYADAVNYMAVASLAKEQTYTAKIRYAHKGAVCRIEQVDNRIIRCVFDEPQRAVTPGQALVFYQGEYVAGGGTIIGTHLPQK